MRGNFNSIVPLPSYRRKLAPHPACGHLPPEGEGSPQKASSSGEAAARRRLMRGNLDSIVPLPSYRRKLAPHPACGHLPPEGEGSPQKVFPAGGRLLIIYLLAHAEGFKHFINRCLCRVFTGQIAQRLQRVRQADGGGVQPKAVLPCADGFGQRITRAGCG